MEVESSSVPRVVLLPHEHTLFCERKQRVCSSVGQLQELEILEIIDLPEHVKSWVWVRRVEPIMSPTERSESVSGATRQWVVIEGSEGQQRYQLQLADVGHHISVRYEGSVRTIGSSSSSHHSDSKVPLLETDISSTTGANNKAEALVEATSVVTSATDTTHTASTHTATVTLASTATTTSTEAAAVAAGGGEENKEESTEEPTVNKALSAMENETFSASDGSIKNDEPSVASVAVTCTEKVETDPTVNFGAAAVAVATTAATDAVNVQSNEREGETVSSTDGNEMISLPTTEKVKEEANEDSNTAAANSSGTSTAISADQTKAASAVAAEGTAVSSSIDTQSSVTVESTVVSSPQSNWSVAAGLGPVQPGPPRLVNFEITGDLVPGDIAVAETHYIGGAQGGSEYWWLKVDQEGRRTTISEAVPCSTEQVSDFKRIIEARIDGVDLSPTELETLAAISKVYVIKEEDLGCVLKAKCRPVRSDGHKGEIFTSRPSLRVIPKGAERPPEDEDSD